jgi:O-antigen/teichoic acid export membrane protein
VSRFRAPETGLRPPTPEVEMDGLGTAVSLDRPTLVGQLQRLVVRSSIYFLADSAARGVSLLLLLAYTQTLTPDDYGTLAVATTITLLLVPLLALSISSAVSRLFFEATDEEGRRRLYGTALAFTLAAGGGAVAVMEAAGQVGLLDVFAAAPWDPYLRIAVLTAYCTLFTDLLVAILIVRGEVRKVALLTVANAAVLLASSLTLVVGLDEGALGVLLAALVAAAATGAVSLVATLRLAGGLRWSSGLLWTALAFSVPLVPHAFSQWLLQVSDRVVLSHYVSASELGLYYVGYSVGAIGGLVVLATGKAFSPLVMRELKDGHADDRVPRLGTYWLTVVVSSCLVLAVYGDVALKTFAPNAYIGAAEIVPIVAFANVLFGVYGIASTGVWYSMRTGWVPVLTAVAALVNVGLNVLLVPRYGIVAAAWDTVAGFGVLALLQGLLAHRSHAIAWELGRWAKLFAAAGAAYLLVGLTEPNLTTMRLVLGAVAIVVVFPGLLLALRFLNPHERRWLAARLGTEA